MNSSPSIVAPTASLANKNRLDHLLSRLGSEADHIGALQMLSSTAAIAAPPSTRRKRPAEASLDRDGSSSDGGGPTESTAPQDETTLQRAKKMQEKNKRAQARYRQRQREKMEGLDDQVIKLSQQNKELAQLNEELHQQKLALQEALDQQRCGRCGGSSKAAAVSTLEVVSQPLPAPRPLNAQAAFKPTHPLLDMADTKHFEIFIPHILKVSAGRQLSSEQLAQPTKLVSALTPQEWYLVYKSFVSDLAMHLMEADKELNPDAAAAVEKLIIGKRKLTTATHDKMGPHVSQEKLEGKSIIHMEPQRQFGPSPPGMWAKVAAAANFTPEQKQVILNVRHKFLEQLQDIIRQRRSIIAELHDSVPDFKSGANGHATITKAFQASHHLCESIVHEHEIVWAFLKEVCHDSMSPLQEARLMVASFPFFPDTPAICNAIANEAHIHAAQSDNADAEGLPSGVSTQTGMVPGDRKSPDAAMSAIFDGLRRDSLPTISGRHTEGHSTSDAATSRPGSRSAGELGEPRLSDTFGLSDMWATQQPLLLDSAWVAALPDLPLGGLPGAFSGGDLFT